MNRRVAFLLAASLLTPLGARAQVPEPTPAPTCDFGPAAVLAAPLLEIRVGGACFDLSDFIQPVRVGDKEVWSIGIGPGTGLPGGVSLGTAALLQSLTATLNPDPFVSFGFSTQNILAGPLTYDVFFGLPIVPDLYGEARSEVEVAMVPGVGASSVSNGLYPTYISGYSNAFATNHGVDLGTGVCTAGVNSPCDYGTTSNTFPPTLYADLGARLSYTQEGQLGVASWAGRVDLLTTAVPEPTTVALMLSGVLVIAGARVTRRRS